MADDQSASSKSYPSRALMVGLAALMVTWLSGLEPTYRKVSTTAASFQAINNQRQQAEAEAERQQQIFDRDQKTASALTGFKKAFPDGKARDRERGRLYRAVKEARIKVPGLPDLPTEKLVCTLPPQPLPGKVDSQNTAERKLASATTFLNSFCKLDQVARQTTPGALETRLKSQLLLLDEGEKKLRLSYEEAQKAAGAVQTDVDFELFGLKFKAALLFAPFLWSAFAFVWLTMLLQEARALQVSRLDIGPQLPAISASGLATALLVSLLWIVQVRVAWIGLAIPSVHGGMHWKAAVTLSLLFMLAASAYVLGTVLRQHRLSATMPPRKFQIGSCTVLLLLVASSILVCMTLPGKVLHGGLVMRNWAPWLSVLPLLLWAWGELFAKGKIAGNGAAGPKRRSLVFSIGALGLTFGVLHILRSRSMRKVSASKKRIAHRARKNEQAAQFLNQASSLKPGFYGKKRVVTEKTVIFNAMPPASRRGSVIHYIAQGPRIHRSNLLPTSELERDKHFPHYRWLVTRSESRALLQPVVETVTSPKISPRLAKSQLPVCLDSASWAFENAAMALLVEHGHGRSNVRAACELLLNGLAHDEAFKSGHPNARRRSSPSFRLYDLLAGLAVRFKEPMVLNELLRRIEHSGQQLVFQSRIRNWTGTNSRWRDRWADRRHPKQWKTNLRAFVF